MAFCTQPLNIGFVIIQGILIDMMLLHAFGVVPMASASLTVTRLDRMQFSSSTPPCMWFSRISFIARIIRSEQAKRSSSVHNRETLGLCRCSQFESQTSEDEIQGGGIHSYHRPYISNAKSLSIENCEGIHLVSGKVNTSHTTQHITV